MKKCKICNKIENDEILVCSGCGGNDFESVEAQQAQYNVTPGEIKGKLNPLHIILIALGCVAVLIAGFLAVNGMLSGESYTKGEIVDGVYINQWANIKFQTDDKWVDITAENAASYEGANYDCGLVAGNYGQGDVLVICFDNLGNTIGYSEQQYLTDYYEGFEEEMTGTLGVEVTLSDFFTLEIAGEEYTAVKSDHGGLYYTYTCIRYKDGYAITFDIFADTEQEIIDLLASVETAPAE